ncbi:MAG: 6-phosphofructokinase, partial [Thermoanaerobaculales bacterium]|nr:6-phosphofructokinase [Thermoanaerobaculales bacterium]
IINAGPDTVPQLIGMRDNRIHRAPLATCVADNHRLAEAIKSRDFDEAMRLRGKGFSQTIATLDTLIQALPRPCPPGRRRLRLAVLTAGGPAPGMNTAVRAAVRFGLDLGHSVVGVHNGFSGLIENDVEELDWMSVKGLARVGGSELGTSRKIPQSEDFAAIAETLSEHRIDALLVVGGWTGYASVHGLHAQRENHDAFRIPMICLPASINNNLPGSELAIGADTALNSIVDCLDKIKQSAVASRRCFVVEVMGGHCGYLALMAGLASGAERVYLHEEGVTLNDLKTDVEHLVEGFEQGKRLGLMIRNERANPCYTTQFMVNLFEEEGGDLFDVRQAILGHLQQGGDPTPFDRIQATRLARLCVDRMLEDATEGIAGPIAIGFEYGRIVFHDLDELGTLSDPEVRRTQKQWWMDLRPVARVLAQAGPRGQDS